MPVTAKLSKKFYDTFGDELTNELVDWFNQVDVSYRAEFRDLFEAHFVRFDAKLDRRTAEIDGRLAALDAKLEQRITETTTRLEARMDTGFATLRSEMSGLRADLIKWMFLFWAGTALTVIGLLKF